MSNIKSLMEQSINNYFVTHHHNNELRPNGLADSIPISYDHINFIPPKVWSLEEIKALIDQAPHQTDPSLRIPDAHLCTPGECEPCTLNHISPFTLPKHIQLACPNDLLDQLYQPTATVHSYQARVNMSNHTHCVAELYDQNKAAAITTTAQQITVKLINDTILNPNTFNDIGNYNS